MHEKVLTKENELKDKKNQLEIIKKKKAVNSYGSCKECLDLSAEIEGI